MANENAVLTALGLDTSQYEAGINKATRATQAFIQVGNTLDQFIRQIPVVGTLWEITGGKVVDAFADMRTAARDFQQVMSKDTTGSLSASLSKIQEINKQIKETRDFSLSRSIAESFQDPMGLLKKGMASVGLGQYTKGGMVPQGEIDREKRDIDLTRERAKILSQLVPLYNDEAEAQSVAYSNSKFLTSERRNQLDLASKLSEIAEEAASRYGPEADRKRIGTEEMANKEIAKRTEIVKKQYAAELALITEKLSLEKQLNDLSEKSSAITAFSIPAEQHLLALKQAYVDAEKAGAEYDSAVRSNIKEDIERAGTALSIASNNVVEQEKQNEIYKERLRLQNQLADLDKVALERNEGGTELDKASLAYDKADAALRSIEKTDDEAAISAAQHKYDLSEAEYKIALRQDNLRKEMLKKEAELASMRLRGATEYEIKLAEIAQKYLGPLAEAKIKDPAAFASLTSQQNSETKSAEIEQRLMGAQGRSNQRQQARLDFRRGREQTAIEDSSARAAGVRLSPMGNDMGLGQAYQDSDTTSSDLSPLGNARDFGRGTGLDSRGGLGTEPNTGSPQQSSSVSQGSFDSKMQELVSILRGGNS